MTKGYCYGNLNRSDAYKVLAIQINPNPNATATIPMRRNDSTLASSSIFSTRREMSGKAK